MSRTGRPTIKTDAVIRTILDGLSQGKTLVSLCEEEGMPAPSTFRAWAREDEQLSIDFARAREDGFDVIAESVLEIADDSRNDWMERAAERGDEIALQFNGEHVQRSKLRIETRMKLLAKWDPRRYGERLELDNKHSGNVGFSLTINPVKK